MNLYLYEDENIKNLIPLVQLRPVFDLLSGTTTLLEKILKLYSGESVILLVREELAPMVKEKYPNLSCNEMGKGGLFLSGRALFNEKIPLVGKEEVFQCEGEIIGFRIGTKLLTEQELILPLSERDLKDWLIDLPRKEVKAKIIRYPWNLIEWNGALIVEEFKMMSRKGKIKGELNQKAVLEGNQKFISMGNGSRVGPFCLLDLTKGPILIERDVEIRPPTLIEGPVFIGEGTLIDGAKIRRGTTIGPVCRIAGEVEETIFQGYTNKHHEGFLGHSYIGEWVNLGAGTTNSDLKNNYEEVRMKIGEKEINTGLIKVGCFIGDHTKTAIGTLIPTGAIFGIFSNLFGGEGMSPKFLPSFSWGTKEPISPYRIEEAMETAKKVMERRGVKMSPAYEDLIRKTYSKYHPSAVRMI